MGKVALFGSNILTAAVVGAGTSLFWIGAYGNGGQNVQVPPAPRVQAPQPEAMKALEIGPTGLAIPVAGVRPGQLADTFSQARAGGERMHDAIDIMAPRGTPVVAAAPGRVEKLYFSEGGGGVTTYVRSPDGKWVYYYAHLDRYAPGLREGQEVARGTPIGFVGSSGNASPDGPHLHFAISRMEPGESWYQGRPVNPYPLLAGRRTAR